MNNLEKVRVHRNLSYISIGLNIVSIIIMFFNFSGGLLIFLITAILYRIEDNTADIEAIKYILSQRQKRKTA